MARRKTHDEFVAEVRALVGEEYEVLGEYANNSTKISIKHRICKTHQHIRPFEFLRGAKCTICHPKKIKNKLITDSEYKTKIFERAGKEFTILSTYRNSDSKMDIRHEICGREFKARAWAFKKNMRCSACSESAGERAVRKITETQGVRTEAQYRIPACKYKNALPFDFAVFRKDDSLAFLVEYDGKQHFEPIEHFGGEETFQQTQLRDVIKTKYCANNNIPLIRIAYYDFDNVDEIMTKVLRKYGVIGAELMAA